MDALRPFLRVVDLGAEDSDAVAPRPLPTDLGSLQSVLKRSSSRPPSKSRGRAGHEDKQEDRSRSRASPERVKPSGALPSYLVNARTTPSLPRSEDPMPDDLSSPTLKAEFLAWTMRNFAETGRWAPGHGLTSTSTCTSSWRENTCAPTPGAWRLLVLLLIQLCLSVSVAGNVTAPQPQVP